MHIDRLSGSPSHRPRSAWLLQLAHDRLADAALNERVIAVRELPAGALLAADVGAAPIRAAIDAVTQADLVILATPIYKAAYSGLLKAFLDLLPQDALRGKTVLPLATGGSLGHLLALDYALKPVLAALGAREILDGVFAADAQLAPLPNGGFAPDEALLARLERAIEPIAAQCSA